MLITQRLAIALAACVLPSPAYAQCLDWSAAFAPSSAGSNASAVDMLVWHDGNAAALYLAGSFTSIGGIAANRSARWDGTSWSALGSGLDGPVSALAVFDDGNGPALYAGGSFSNAGTGAAANIARWDGASWSALGAGVGGAVQALATYDDGTGAALFVGGMFSTAGGASANYIAKWDGAQWSALGSGLSVGPFPSGAFALQAFDAGSGPRLYVGGRFNAAGGVPATNGIASWNGSAWFALGTTGLSLTTFPPNFPDYIGAFEVFDFGTGPELVAAGTFTSVSAVPALNIARWNGSVWQAFGSGGPGGAVNGPMNCLAVFDDGGGASLYAGGSITPPGAPANTQKLARWTGSAWISVGGGLSIAAGGGPPAPSSLCASQGAIAGEHALYVSGNFLTAGTSAATRLAQWRGCAGPGQLMCFGDGTQGACPCANSGASRHGCANSAAATGALLSSSGATQPDTLELRSQGELSSALTIFLQGDLAVPPAPFGDGLLCASGNLLRLYAKFAVNGLVLAPEAGDPSITARAAAQGDAIGAGMQRWYQAYYRDPSTTHCPAPLGNTWTITNGIVVVW